MNNRKVPYFMILVVTIALLVFISPVGADHDEAHTAYEHNAEISAMRWQAMGKFYEDHGMLTRDNFDYEEAADRYAARWQAMGNFYEDQGLLTRDNFDYEKAADRYAARWQAMGKFYEDQGLLTRANFD